MKKSQEDYLETILKLSKAKNVVRSIDVANDLNFSKPSVSVAMKKLKEENLITIEDSGHIKLTSVGLIKAEAVYEKHLVLSSLLMAIGVSEEIALEDACKIEHDLSEETFTKLKEYYKKHLG